MKRICRFDQTGPSSNLSSFEHTHTHTHLSFDIRLYQLSFVHLDHTYKKLRIRKRNLNVLHL